MTIGFSTGALCRGDFRQGHALCQQAGLKAIELSALRYRELPALIDALDDLDLTDFEHVSVHAPSVMNPDEERHTIDLLHRAATRGIPIVVHPDAIGDREAWVPLQQHLLIENMDRRKPVGRTAEEMSECLEPFPEAMVCLDLGHARQVDPSMTVAAELLERFGDRIGQLHVSEVNAQSGHDPLSYVTVEGFRQVAHLLPEEVVVILESTITPDLTLIEAECQLAATALSPAPASGHAVVAA